MSDTNITRTLVSEVNKEDQGKCIAMSECTEELLQSKYGMKLPLIVKPIRGRGSEGNYHLWQR